MNRKQISLWFIPIIVAIGIWLLTPAIPLSLQQFLTRHVCKIVVILIISVLILLVNAFHPEWIDKILFIFYLPPQKLDIQNVPVSYKFGDRNFFFPDENYSAFVRRKKVYIFLKPKPKKYLCWIDYMYLICLRNMRKLRYKPIVLVHDFAYDTNTHNLIFRQANDEALINSRIFIQKIIGRSCKIYTVSETLEHKGVSFADLYGKVFSLCSCEVDKKVQSGETILYSQLMDLLYGYYVKAAIESFVPPDNKNCSAVVVQFEARKDKWKITGNPRFGILLSMQVVWGSDPLRTKNYNDSINITDPQQVLYEKMDKTGFHTSDISFIGALNRLLLSTLPKKVKEQLVKKYKIQLPQAPKETLTSIISQIRATYEIPEVER